MIVKSTLLAVIVFFGSLTIANAQPYINGGSPGQFTALGWNFGHIAHCETFFDGTNTWHLAFVVEGGFGFTNNPGFATLIAAACQSGNLIAVHVTNLNPFSWNSVAVFPFK
jgi:hypothetical protein